MHFNGATDWVATQAQQTGSEPDFSAVDGHKS